MQHFTITMLHISSKPICQNPLIHGQRSIVLGNLGVAGDIKELKFLHFSLFIKLSKFNLSCKIKPSIIEWNQRSAHYQNKFKTWQIKHIL